MQLRLYISRRSDAAARRWYVNCYDRFRRLLLTPALNGAAYRPPGACQRGAPLPKVTALHPSGFMRAVLPFTLSRRGRESAAFGGGAVAQSSSARYDCVVVSATCNPMTSEVTVATQ